MNKLNNKRIFTNFFWRFAERFGAQGVAFVVSMILARLLEPSVYGTVALVTVFTTIMQVFVDSGMANALIQKKNADDIDFSSVFYFNMITCVLLYAVMFFAAPFIAGFFEKPELTALVRVLSLTLVISGVKNVQQAYVARNMRFKRFFFATLGGTLIAAMVGISMAYLGFGVWALVAQNLLNAAIGTLILWATVKWRPKRMFSIQRLKGLLSFGWKLLVSNLLDKVYINLRSLIIGKLYTSEELAFYNKGDQFPELFVSNINTSIDGVLLPVLSAEQDHRSHVRDMTRRAIKISSYIMMPLMVGLAICAEPLVSLVLSDTWLPCVPFLRISCLTYAFYPIHTANLNAVKAMGYSDLFLKLEVAKKIIGLTALLLTMRFGVIAMAYSMLFTSVLSQIINAWPNRRLLDYSYIKQLKDIFPCVAMSVLMGVCIWPVQLLRLADWLTLALQVILGVVIYIAGSKVFRIDSFSYLLSVFSGLLKKNKKESASE